MPDAGSGVPRVVQRVVGRIQTKTQVSHLFNPAMTTLPSSLKGAFQVSWPRALEGDWGNVQEPSGEPENLPQEAPSSEWRRPREGGEARKIELSAIYED